MEDEKISKTCEEASPLSRAFFIPCGRPASRRVHHDRDNKTYSMCAGCADHNIRNRGAKDAGPMPDAGDEWVAQMNRRQIDRAERENGCIDCGVLRRGGSLGWCAAHADRRPA